MAKQTYTTGQVLTAAQMTALQANDYNWTVSAKTTSYVLVAADAGTRITMSNAGATTITVNTALFTAGDTLTITNIGAGACTITAGTATVSTAGSLILNQYDSGTLYFSSTSAAIWNGANPGDITGITTGATSGLAGGVTSGTASLTLATAAKGDLLVGTGSNTAQVLTVGSNNQTLVADSSTSTGLKWATPASSGSLPTFSAYKNASTQTFSVSTYTKITFDVENWDAPGCFASSTFTPTSAGYYLISSAVYHQQVGNGDFTLLVYKNGSNWQRLYINNPTSAGVARMDTGSTLVYCNGTTDYIEIYARGDLGGNVSIIEGATLTYFSAIGIRA